jgi:hypothetical protein
VTLSPNGRSCQYANHFVLGDQRDAKQGFCGLSYGLLYAFEKTFILVGVVVSRAI